MKGVVVKVRLMFGVLSFSLVVLGLASPSAYAGGFAGGTGKPDAPYQIATPKQLIAVGKDPNLWDKHFVLTRDLDMA